MWLVAAAPALAGEIKIAWDPVVGATGYYVDYGTSTGNLPLRYDAGPDLSATVRNLSDCQDWFFAVRGYNSTQIGPASAVVSDWAQPVVSTTVDVLQGELFTLDLDGANFRAGMSLTTDNPGVQLSGVTRTSCTNIQASVVVGPAGPGARAAQVGVFDLVVTNPSGIHDGGADEFVIRIDPARFDVDRGSQSTEDRIDGSDLSRLTYSWGGCDLPVSSGCNAADAALYVPDLDFDGDGWIDGEDLSHIAMHRWGLCWSPQQYEWTASPSVHPTAGLICPTVTP